MQAIPSPARRVVCRRPRYGASGMERGGWNKLITVLPFAYFGANQPERSESMCTYENKHEHITKSPCAGDRGALKLYKIHLLFFTSTHYHNIPISTFVLKAHRYKCFYLLIFRKLAFHRNDCFITHNTHRIP